MHSLNDLFHPDGTPRFRVEIAPPSDSEGVDADLNLIYGDDAEPSDTVLFDLLDSDPDPCPGNPGGHEFIGKCGETRCRHCPKVVG